jgi:hypothetical protein
MPDLYSPEDEAALYVMGMLTPSERREFEEQLAQSSPLRSLVRELEEGAVALSMALPQKRLPQPVWARIEKAVAAEAKRKEAIPAFWANWWKSGWAAAAACLISWLFYALWTSRPGPDVSPSAQASQSRSATTAIAKAPPPKIGGGDRENRNSADATPELLQQRVQEVARLRRQLVELADRVTSLSESLTQEQALLGETNRFRFIQLTPISNDGEAVAVAPLSPAMQRAIFLAMARELGWLPPAKAASGDETATAFQTGQTNQANVDYLDLRPGSNGETNAAPSSLQTGAQRSDTPAPSLATNAPGSTIQAFISGTNMFVAIDPLLAPAGSQVSISTGSNGQQTLGTAMMGSNALVIAVPVGSAYPNGQTLTITTGTSVGLSNIFQYFIPGTSPP